MRQLREPPRLSCVVAASVLMLSAIDAAAANVKRDVFARSLSAFIAQLASSPHAPPGFVVVAVHGGDTVFERAYGTRNTATEKPVTLDTPIYNASSTKAYTGLLAAIFDEEGVLSLDATLQDVWPDMARSVEIDPAAIRASALLAHSAAIREGGVQFRSNITGDITAADVPRRLTTYAVKREPEFRYANFGPYVWSTMMEAKTGVAWRDMIERKVFAPLNLRRTSARVEGFSDDEIARCHAREQGRWNSLPFKPTPILNAAGGIFTSGRDAGQFLKAFLTDGKSAQGRVTATALRRTWQRQTNQDQALWGMHRDGYGLGWDLGTYDDHRFVSRSGAAAGCRSMILFLPAEQFGIAVMSLGDAAVNTFNSLIFEQAIDLWTADAQAEQRARTRLTDYAAAARDAFKTADAVDARLARRVKLEPAAAQALVGVYENERLGRFVLAYESHALTLTAGVFAAQLIPIGGDEFALVQRGLQTPEPEAFRLTRSPTGAVTGFMWDDDRYDRRDE